MDHMAILAFTFRPDVILELLDPGIPFFSTWLSAYRRAEKIRDEPNLLCRVKHVLENHASAGHVDGRWQGLHFGDGLDDSALIVGAIDLRFRHRFVSSCKLSHQRIPAVVVEVDASHIGVIQGASASSPLVIVSSASAVEGASSTAGVRSTSAVPRKSGTLKVTLLIDVAVKAVKGLKMLKGMNTVVAEVGRVAVVAMKALQQIGSRFGRELIVSKANTNRPTGKVESVHLLQGLARLIRIPESLARPFRQIILCKSRH